MIRWMMTFLLAVLVVVASFLSGIAHVHTSWLPEITYAGFPFGGLLAVTVAASAFALLSSVVPLIRALSLHARFNLAMLAVVLGAFRLGLL